MRPLVVFALVVLAASVSCAYPKNVDISRLLELLSNHQSVRQTGSQEDDSDFVAHLVLLNVLQKCELYAISNSGPNPYYNEVLNKSCEMVWKLGNGVKDMDGDQIEETLDDVLEEGICVSIIMNIEFRKAINLETYPGREQRLSAFEKQMKDWCDMEFGKNEVGELIKTLAATEGTK